MLEKLREYFKTNFDVAIVIAPLTAVSYGITYTYECSYNHFFRLNSSYIDITITSLTKTMLLLITFLFLAFLIIYIEDKLHKSLNNRFKFFHFLAQSKYGLVLRWSFVLFIIIFFQKVSLIVLFLIILLIVTLGHFKKYKTAIAASLIGLFIFAYVFGSEAASDKRDFLIIEEGSKNLVVLNVYKNQYITAPVDFKTQTISPEFQIIKLTSTRNKEILRSKYVHTGKLSMNYYSIDLVNPNSVAHKTLIQKLKEFWTTREMYF
ncbi:hypothetical protein [Neobacillus sp. 114]|uniref:hypothetical protein n=1 Tax=Neobacillus sp. 114 TaxID=3048535 RepID=UPI0024C45ACF|nr:hypothetical protein [Neobacillus sp. 114]